MAKKVFAAAGYTTVFYGPGRNEFNPKSMPPFEHYLEETAAGTCKQVLLPEFDEGIIGSFMSARFIKQANLCGFLPFMVPSLEGKPCTAVEGACGTGGRAIAMAVRSILSGLSDSVFVAAFEMQNTVKAVYGADILAGAAYYAKERKSGNAFFFPGIFAMRAGAYQQRYGEQKTREAMALWYEKMIQNARLNPKAQEYHNSSLDLFQLGMTKPDPDTFLPYLNLYDCSKVTDGAVSIVIASEDGLKKLGIPLEAAIEVIALGEAQGDITKQPDEPTFFSTTHIAVNKGLAKAKIPLTEISLLELHDCFTICALLALEASGWAKPGKSAEFIGSEQVPLINLSGGLCGFGHPTGASGVRQLVDLLHQFTGKAANQAAPKTPFGMLISMGGNDKTVTSVIVSKT